MRAAAHSRGCGQFGADSAPAVAPATGTACRRRCCPAPAGAAAPTPSALEVRHRPPGHGVDELVGCSAAPTRELLREHLLALEAEAGAAVAAHHLVALLVLRGLPIEVLLGDGHAASRALRGTRLLHPTSEGLLRLVAPLLREGLAREAAVERLRAATEAGSAPAERAAEAQLAALLEGHDHGAVRRGAVAQVRRLGDRMCQASCLQALADLWRQ
mmetsp:Transcript_114886/g.320012  ORF Transcript_114886/g.320012 Transcript_114886/m.320012 type:complete len:215 (+) Transcript_114886:121-765(+)